MATDILPDDFFKIGTPTSPWMSVQFRTQLMSTGDVETKNVWEELAINPNSFVESINIEDNGGAKKLTLVLFDKYFSTIERIVMQSVFVTRISNAATQKATTATTAKNGDLDMSVVCDATSFVNLRIRIGYTDRNGNAEDGTPSFFESTTEQVGAFEGRERVKKPTIRTPWMYFMINGVNNDVTENGLRMTVTGLSLTSNVLNNTKIIQKFAKITGTPKNIITELKKYLDQVNGSVKIRDFGNTNTFGQSGGVETVTTSMSEPPIEIDGQKEIEILIGGEPKADKYGNNIISYKSVGELINEICQKTPPIYLDSEGNQVIPTISQTGEEATPESENVINYSYFIDQENVGGVITDYITFYYPNPERAKKKQTYLRNYFWREYGKTIVKNVNIQTATDFATMSTKIIANTSSGVGVDEYTLLASAVDKTEGKIGISPNLGVNKTAMIQANADYFDFKFVSDVVDIPEPNDIQGVDNKTAIKWIMNQFIKNINRQVFKGTIELPGDPFYLFDRVVRPYEYLIKLIIMRPTASGVVEKSYLTGNYAITSITHNVSGDGYSTTLGIMRWPEKEEEKKVDPKQRGLAKGVVEAM